LIDLLSIHWILGDLLRFAEGKFSDKVSQLEHEWGFKYQTYANDKWVANKIDWSVRTDRIPFRHYEAIASYEHKDQKIWIKKILDENDNFERKKIYGKKICQYIGISLSKSRQTIQYAIQFARKYPDLNKLPVKQAENRGNYATK